MSNMSMWIWALFRNQLFIYKCAYLKFALIVRADNNRNLRDCEFHILRNILYRLKITIILLLFSKFSHNQLKVMLTFGVLSSFLSKNNHHSLMLCWYGFYWLNMIGIFSWLQSCSIYKQKTDSALYVAFGANMGITGCDSCCKRWYFTFNNVECSPITIDGIIYQENSVDMSSLMHRNIAGR